MQYVIVTPARNEERYIRLTLESMIGQSHPPQRWVIVSDGSTDRTDEIVTEYSSRIEWIELLRLPVVGARTFAAKVNAFNAGHERVRHLPFDIIGNLDADISFGPDYFAFLLQKFSENPRLGVAGTPFVEEGITYNYRYSNIEHVSGACQLFRRECFSDIGGYLPIEGGGVDWAAVTTARMKGWHTRTFLERTCAHHRLMGTGASKVRLVAFFKHGQREYAFGGHPVWQLLRTAYQMTRRPYVIGGAALLAGYAWAFATRRERPVSEELVQFNRSEQMARLRATLGRRRG